MELFFLGGGKSPFYLLGGGWKKPRYLNKIQKGLSYFSEKVNKASNIYLTGQTLSTYAL